MDKKIGEGSYSRVYKIKIGDEILALKRNVIEREIKGTGNVRELDILLKCKGHPNIVQLEKISLKEPFKNMLSPIKERTSKEDDIYMIFEYADSDLDDLITQNLDLETIRAVLYQMLIGVEFLHVQNIIHRDLKPPNFLVFTEGGLRIKICDFGLSNHLSTQGARTPRVCTSEYRAPEVWLGAKDYGPKIDIWSIGCILYEILKKEVFLTVDHGNPEGSIRNLIRSYPEKISREDILAIGGKGLVGRLPKNTNTWESLFPKKKFSHDLVYLLQKMLAFNPKSRWTATECLNYGFFDPIRGWISKVRNFPVPNYVYEIDYNPYTEALILQLKKIIALNINCQWFNFRAIFITLNIILRYTAKIIYDPNFIPLSQLHCYSMLYLAIKYLTTSNLNYEPTWTEITPENLKSRTVIKQCCRFEQTVLDQLGYEVYTPTPYDIANVKLIKEQSEDLFNYMILNPRQLHGLTAREIFNNFVATIEPE